jgi:YjbE family integral membrane protein
MTFDSPEFWVALLQIIGVNIVLSGDNAVVIALAARGLPVDQQKRAVAWGSGAAVVMRIVLTIVAVELLRLPYLKLVGAGLLLWIAIQLLTPEEEGGGHEGGASSMAAAVKTILLADLVMSLDNVIAVAAAAKGNITLLVAGLAISIPLVVFASRLLLTLMERFPIIITLGAALLGWVAGEMAVGDPAIKEWVDAHAAWLHLVGPAAGVAVVLLVGKLLAGRGAAAEQASQLESAPVHAPSALQRVLLAVDGSPGSAQAVAHWLALRAQLREPAAVAIDLLNVQRPITGDVANFVASASIEDYHRERSEKALAAARSQLQQAGLSFEEHRQVGDPGPIIAAMAQSLDSDLIVMGTRGLGTHTGTLLGSVARGTLEHATVPVLLARG